MSGCMVCGKPQHARGLCSAHYQSDRHVPVPNVPGSWHDAGACKGKPTGWFYVPDEKGMGGNRGRKEFDLIDARAKKLCLVCIVRRPCLEYALAHHEAGWWGGTGETERRAIRAQRAA